jgi:hypothetical protein
VCEHSEAVCEHSEAMSSEEMRQSRSKVKAWIKQTQKEPQELVTEQSTLPRDRCFERTVSCPGGRKPEGRREARRGSESMIQGANSTLFARLQQSNLLIVPSDMRTCPEAKQQTITENVSQSSSWRAPLDLLGIGGLFGDEERNVDEKRCAGEDVESGDVALMGPDGPINVPIAWFVTRDAPRMQTSRSSTPQTIVSAQSTAFRSSDNWIIQARDPGCMPRTCSQSHS